MARNTQCLAIAQCIGTSSRIRSLVMGVPVLTHKRRNATAKVFFATAKVAAFALTTSANERRLFCFFRECHFTHLCLGELL
jgi:flagellar biosynthesis protein FliR